MKIRWSGLFGTSEYESTFRPAPAPSWPWPDPNATAERRELRHLLHTVIGWDKDAPLADVQDFARGRLAAIERFYTPACSTTDSPEGR